MDLELVREAFEEAVEGDSREEFHARHACDAFREEFGCLDPVPDSHSFRFRGSYEVVAVDGYHTAALATCAAPIPPYNFVHARFLESAVGVLRRVRDWAAVSKFEPAWLAMHPGMPYPVAFGLRGEPWCVLVAPTFPDGEEPW